MKKQLIFFVGLLLLLSSFSFADGKYISTQKQAVEQDSSFSYAMGLVMGDNLRKRLNVSTEAIDIELLAQSVLDVLSGKKTKEEIATASGTAQEEAKKLYDAKEAGSNYQPEKSFNSNIGIYYSVGLQKGGITAADFDKTQFVKGMRAAYGLEAIEFDMATAQQIMEEKMKEKEAAVAQKNLEEGKKFLAENAKKKGIKKTASGLQYQVLKKGKGPKPKKTDKVTTHYSGSLIDGTVFDSSVERNEPVEFPLDQVIKGWTEILQLMPKGSKWKVYIPADLAYGDAGIPGVIPPNAVLVFEIELLKINGN